MPLTSAAVCCPLPEATEKQDWSPWQRGDLEVSADQCTCLFVQFWLDMLCKRVLIGKGSRLCFSAADLDSWMERCNQDCLPIAHILLVGPGFFTSS